MAEGSATKDPSKPSKSTTTEYADALRSLKGTVTTFDDLLEALAKQDEG